MRIIKLIFFGICLTSSLVASAQLIELKGKVIGVGRDEGLHILNKTALKYNITDENGYFEIPAKVNDTVVFSGLTYKLKEVVITKTMISKNKMEVYLTENITQLDQVTVGKILTGDIDSDLRNLDIETPINFYDLGILGYTGKPKTLSERKLISATSGGGIPLVGLINAITGKTKELKERIALDKDINCVEKLKVSYKDLIFEDENLPEELQNRFFNYIIDSENLQKACYSSNVLSSITFLKEELKLFKTQLTLDAKED
ncbi:MAG: hypothetical protein HKP48_10870 [Winogradskyella sp.]|uniref:hypothetical protein n=1 Tax=Winogradskyella sp. TaxID=1883156 RepID=UPI0017B3B0C7|nr:hypothetical protein [Winogradskyella sp.]MBT8244069.1 carboxypeptidase-like regulatory domain-containing protein [Winogradskyella sp.]NNK23762.1 hypothetical protein [Winogradskyella sp.]